MKSFVVALILGASAVVQGRVLLQGSNEIFCSTRDAGFYGNVNTGSVGYAQDARSPQADYMKELTLKPGGGTCQAHAAYASRQSSTC
ncbi:hypothetical protein WJX73_001240 [Symbiochloris irregularis]|uniref:Uncharacterized protein n=1 Tax=Symbiochloris irregularis TaxID=706552 RepID=A0AAW1P909_9CHLO